MFVEVGVVLWADAPKPKAPICRGGSLSGVLTEIGPLSPFWDSSVSLKVNSGVNKDLQCNFVSPDGMFCARSFGSIKSLGACCPRPRILPPLCTGWGSSPPTTLWPNLASGTLFPSSGRWRRPRARLSTVAWYVLVQTLTHCPLWSFKDQRAWSYTWFAFNIKLLEISGKKEAIY